MGKMNGVLNYMYVMAKVKAEQQQTADRHGEVKSAGCGYVAVSADYLFSLFTVQVWQVLPTILTQISQHGRPLRHLVL